MHTIEDEKAPASPLGTLGDVENAGAFDKDIAIAMVGEHRRAIDPAIEARVVRKIDWFLIPAMSVGYGLVYYDKACVTFPTSGILTDNPRPSSAPPSSSE